MSLRISRRTVLRGLGTAVALPWLEAMRPLSAGAADADKLPVRAVFLEVPNGVNMSDWTPDAEGDGFALKPTLEPLAPFRSRMLVLSGLTLDGARAHGDGGGDHARSCAAFLTGAHPKKTYGADIRNGVSVDQFAAAKIGGATRFPSLELGIDRGAQSGNCDSGYSCAYSANLSWRTETAPVAKEVDPAAVFDRLFGSGSNSEQAQARMQRNRGRKSILDFAAEDARQLTGQLGAADRRKLDEYLYAVRDVERRLQGEGGSSTDRKTAVDYPRPQGTPREFEAHVKLLFDLIALAFQTDATRIVTFMYCNEGSNRNYPQIGVNEGHHDLSHHGNDVEKQAKISKIDRFHITLFSHLVEQLNRIQERDQPLLSNCMVMYGAGIGDGNRHNHDDLPIILIGNGGGAIRGGRHLRYPQNTPLTNLYLNMLQVLGAATDKFGDSSGPLDRLG
jgi:hypothetical protein